MIIDAHVHVWPTGRQSIPAAPGEWVRDVAGDLELLLAEMDRHQVQRAVLVQTPWHHHDNGYLTAAHRNHPGRFALVGHLPGPTGDQAGDELRRQHEHDRLAGLRVHLLDRAIIDRVAGGESAGVLDYAAERRLPVSLLYQDQANHEVVADLARRHPAVDFVIDYFGWVRAADNPWPLLTMAGLDNVHVRLSNHLKLSDEGSPWPELVELQHSLVREFGPERMLWGSNFPMPEDRHAPFAERLGCVANLDFLTDADRAAILGETAARLIGGSQS